MSLNEIRSSRALFSSTCSFVTSSLTWSVLLHVFAGGAGGKGVWGRSGEVYGPEQVDAKDPNYDEAQVR